MKMLKLSSASGPLSKYVSQLGQELLVLTDRNKPVAAIVPLDKVDRETLALSAHPEFLELIAQARGEFAAGKTVSFEAMKRAVMGRHRANKRLGRSRKARRSAAFRK